MFTGTNTGATLTDIPAGQVLALGGGATSTVAKVAPTAACVTVAS